MAGAVRQRRPAPDAASRSTTRHRHRLARRLHSFMIGAAAPAGTTTTPERRTPMKEKIAFRITINAELTEDEVQVLLDHLAGYGVDTESAVEVEEA